MAEAVERLAEVAEARMQIEQRREQRAEEAATRAFQDRIGSRRREPRRLPFLTMCRAAPGLAEQFGRKIPAEFWSLDGNVATVACPCGEEPRSEEGIPVGCGCDRSYLYDGQSVRIAGGPKGEPATTGTTPPAA